MSALPSYDDMVGKGMNVKATSGAGPSSPQQGSTRSSASSVSGLSRSVVACVYGQVCLLCGVKDEEADNVLPSVRRAWGYDPDPATGRNLGQMCLQCRRVYRARFRGKYPTAEALVAGFGKDGQLHKLFRYWCEMAENAMKAAGSHAVRITWGSEESAKKLLLTNSRETRIESPEDEVWPVAEYERAQRESWGQLRFDLTV